ncbi:MAG TPA: cupin domain-containing protein [Nocardioides sp.]|nr:cupin domain-containing protein [Nocardioides sp.]
MQSISLTQLAEERLSAAQDSGNGRASATIFGGREHDMRQTLIALASGHALNEHESPGEASLQVLSGEVRISAGEESWSGMAGDYLVIPPLRHDLQAVSDAVVLLTVATRA